MMVARRWRFHGHSAGADTFPEARRHSSTVPVRVLILHTAGVPLVKLVD